MEQCNVLYIVFYEPNKANAVSLDHFCECQAWSLLNLSEDLEAK